MEPAVAATLAQIVPVLFLTMLFEVRLRPKTESSVLGVVFGFLGNLAVAVGCIVLEFSLLGIVQSNSPATEANWVWTGGVVLFSVVVFRWTATTAFIRFAASTQFARTFGRSAVESASISLSLFREMGTVMRTLLSPSQLFADFAEHLGKALAVLAGGFMEALADIGTALLALIGVRPSRRSPGSTASSRVLRRRASTSSTRRSFLQKKRRRNRPPGD